MAIPLEIPTPVAWQEINSLLKVQIGEFRKINSGIHISLLGTTRGGKTMLATGGKTGNGILSHFETVLCIDSTGDPGFISEYGEPYQKYRAIKGHRRLTVTNMSVASRKKIYDAISKAVSQGNVAIYFDELRQITEKKYFDLGKVCDYLWLFCAKKQISVIGSTQAPRWMPGAFYDQSKLHFLFGNRDRRAMKRLAEISGDVDTLEIVLPSLKEYQFAMVDKYGDVRISKFELPTTEKVASVKTNSEKKFVINRA